MPRCVRMSKYLLKEGSISCWAVAHAQVLAAQRGKEAAEEREQNVSLSEQVEALRSSAASAAQVRLLTAGCAYAMHSLTRPAILGLPGRTLLDDACHNVRFMELPDLRTSGGTNGIAAGGGGDGKGGGAAGGAGADEQDQGAARRGAAQGVASPAAAGILTAMRWSTGPVVPSG